MTVIYSFRVSGDVLVDFRGLQLFGLKRTGTFSGLNAVQLSICQSGTFLDVVEVVVDEEDVGGGGGSRGRRGRRAFLRLARLG